MYIVYYIYDVYLYTNTIKICSVHVAHKLICCYYSFKKHLKLDLLIVVGIYSRICILVYACLIHKYNIVLNITHTYTNTYTHIHTHTHTYTHIHTHTHTYTHAGGIIQLHIIGNINSTVPSY